MSEYQVYEFRCIDKPLTEKQKKVIGGWSSRTYPTSTGAVFTYCYGDFPQDEKKVVEKYFDAMFYMANWGSKSLIFKFPKNLIEIDLIKEYCCEGGLSLSEKGENALLDFSFDDEEAGGWIEEDEGWLDSLIGLREDILKGDYRSLYLSWLYVKSFQEDWEEFDETETEPPVPVNLDKLNSSLKSFVELLEIDPDLISAGAKESPSARVAPDLDFEDLIKKLTTEEKDDFLLRLAKGEPLLSASLLNRLKKFQNKTKPALKQSNRTIGAILKEAEEIRRDRRKTEQKKREAKRKIELKKMELQEPSLWKEAYRLIAEKKTKSYDEAVKILKDLKGLADYKKEAGEFIKRVQQILEENTKLPGLKSRILQAKLVK